MFSYNGVATNTITTNICTCKISTLPFSLPTLQKLFTYVPLKNCSSSAACEGSYLTLPYGSQDWKGHLACRPRSHQALIFCHDATQPLSGMSYQMCAQWASKFALNAATEAEQTTFAGRVFQLSTTRTEKTDLLTLQTALGFKTLNGCPLVMPSAASVKKSSGLMSTPPWNN